MTLFGINISERIRRAGRNIAVPAAMVILAGCTTTSNPTPVAFSSPVDPLLVRTYAAPADEPYKVDAVDVAEIDPKYLRQVVDFSTSEPFGTVIVDPHQRFLYLVREHGTALRYGVGVGKAGLEFSGTATVEYKKKWPRWTPTSDMIKREPGRYKPWQKGMDGGARNPLGRASYLFKGGKDNLYRIHGTTEPWSIGKGLSSGCVGMLSQDVIGLSNACLMDRR